jgi:hypothetical protein
MGLQWTTACRIWSGTGLVTLTQRQSKACMEGKLSFMRLLQNELT